MRAYPLLALLLASSPAAAAVPTGCQEDYSSCKEDCAIEHGGSGRAIKKLTSCIAECQETLDHCANRHSSLKDLPPGVADDSRPARRAGPARKKTKKDLEKEREENPFGDDEPAPKRSSKGDPYGDEPSADAKGGTDRRESYRASEAPREEVPPARESAPPRGAPGSRATSSRANAEEAVMGNSADGSKRSGYRASDAEPEPEKSLGLEGLEPLDEKPEPAPTAKSGAKSAPVKAAEEPVKSEPEKPAAAASSARKDPLLDEEQEPAVLPAPPPTRKPATTKAPPKPTPAEQPKKDISEWDPNGD